MIEARGGRSGPRPGGRSARVQAAVHRAVRELQQEVGEAELTVPQVAARAGVTPSTIYRRWGTLAQLLSDVALDALRPDTPPAETGSFRGDMAAWLTAFLEETASEPGRAVVRDVLAEPANACQCAVIAGDQIEQIRQRAIARGETPPPTDTLIDRLLAPVVYRILFSPDPPTPETVQTLLDETLARPA